MKKNKTAAALAALALLLAAGTQANAEEVKTINMYTMGIGTTTDSQLIQDAINEISREKIGVEINWTILDIGQWFEQYNLLLSGSEVVDLMPNMGGVAAGVRQGAFLELEDLYAEYGQGIAEYLDEEFLKAGYINGHLYGIPNQKDFAATTNITYRQDIIDELGLDVSGVAALEDWVPIMEAVQEAYPDMTMFVSNGGNSLNQWTSYDWDKLDDGLGVLMNYGEEATVVNLYETEEYENLVREMREWYEAGYVAKDTATATEVYSALIKAGNAFCSITTGNPGLAEEQTQNCGYPMGTIALTEPLATTLNVTTMLWGIPYASAEPEAAMEFLNLMYTDKDISNLLNYGIEGIHYTVQEDGTLYYPEGTEASDCTYHPEMTWIWPNTYIADQWAAATKDLGTKMNEFNRSAKKSIAMGWTFDSTTVANEVTACTNVVREYAFGLEVGAVDVDEVLPKFQQALKDAGIDRIIAEKQAQLDAWLAE
ncbi:MAG: ABC transporter substrate-binding protein [Eubacteriales bacterium]|nr:ABC transporter substrate-binding protein [Eubacteriales bacterium]